MKIIKYPYPCKVGDMIYPVDMKREYLFDKWSWGVITKVSKKGVWAEIEFFQCVECARLYSTLLKAGVLKK